MKLIIILLSTISTVVFFDSNRKDQNHQRELCICDSITDTLFYGLTAQEIAKMPIDRIKVFCLEKGISLPKFIMMRTKAKNYLLKEKIRHDSIETARIYEEVDELLDIDN